MYQTQITLPASNAIRWLLRVALVTVVLVVAVLPVGAASWARGVQGDCSGFQPKGASWINWSGYYVWDWGQTNHTLWYHNGSIWVSKASADSGRVYGGTDTALANTAAQWISGQWLVDARYTASFTTSASDYYYFNC